MKDFLDKVGDLYIKLTKKFDELSEIIYERTGKKINIGVIVLLTIIAIIMFFIIRSFLRWFINYLK